MAFEERNLAYDLSLFEDDDKMYTTVPQSTRKKQNPVQMQLRKSPLPKKPKTKMQRKDREKNTVL